MYVVQFEVRYYYLTCSRIDSKGIALKPEVLLYEGWNPTIRPQAIKSSPRLRRSHDLRFQDALQCDGIGSEF